ncbi:hypothetical protein ACP70R_014555 [Stipagrostis hirtigluma subsp. patula]
MVEMYKAVPSAFASSPAQSPTQNPRIRFASMAPPPELNDDVTAQVLLRLPPDEPELLFRAALVCKPWLRILCDPAFLRRYRAFHGAPPLLGLLHRLQVLDGDPAPRLASTTAAPLCPYPEFSRSRALDCRHGRVLLHVLDRRVEFGLLVWDPVTGDQQGLPDVDFPWLIYSAAVLCAVPGCDHLGCRGGPFVVIFVATHEYKDTILATVYSSETGAWSEPVSVDNGFESYVQPRRGALVGDEIYFTLHRGDAIVKYDRGNNCLTVISPPPPKTRNGYIALMTMEDSSLGLAGFLGSSLYLWSRKVNSEGAAEWVQCRVLELETTLPVSGPNDKPGVVGFAEGVDVIFVRTGVGLFMVELKSGRVRNIGEAGVYFSVLPYMSFYTPDRGTLASLARTC